jgi:CheY-like chemotaxis protein
MLCTTAAIPWHPSARIQMRKKLLLADDSLTIQRVIEQTFADEAIDVATVSDGEAAVLRLGDDPPDILLADIGMPGRDGYEVALHVRRTPALAHIPVILLTGAFDPVDYARARAAGCAGVLVKPFDPQMLIARVRHLLEERPARAVPGEEPAPGDVSARGVDVEFAAEPDAAKPTHGGTSTPAPSAGSTADVNDYFARLDRAFAALQTVAPASTPDATAIDAAGGQTPMPPPGGAPGKPDTRAMAIDAPPQTAAHDAEGPPAPTEGLPVADRQSPSRPTLGGAFAALLAIEQGQPLPEAAGWASAVTGDLVEHIARRVSREISERVVRELAPDIISEVAERLVREEIARIAAVQHER